MTQCTKISNTAHAMAVWNNYAPGDFSPLTNPTAHLVDLLMHSSFDYYVPAPGYPVDVPITHSAVAADPGTDVSGGLGLVISYTSVTDLDIAVTTHGLGYVPNFMVSLNGIQYPAGCPIQVGADGARRCITFWADTTKLWVRDSARPSIPGLPALSVTYHVTIFRDPSNVSGAPLFKAYVPTASFQMGYGRIPADSFLMRTPAAGETTYAIPAGETLSLANGRPRFALPNGGAVFDVGPLIGTNTYNGSFFGGPVKQVFIS